MADEVKNGKNYKCKSCGSRGRELPVCDCGNPRPKEIPAPEPAPAPKPKRTTKRKRSAKKSG